MKIDIVSQVCVYNDYPIWRTILQKYRDKFGKIIMYPSRHHGYIDQEEFLKRVFPENWVDPVPIEYGVEDWRQAETIPLLSHVNADWILFMEQDFFVDDWGKLWKDTEEAMKVSDAIGWWNETAFPYLHPCFFLIKREVLDKTQKDFKAHPEIPGCDHFAMITRDLEAIGAKITKLQDLGYKNWENAFHLGGLTYPYQNWKGDGSDHFGVGNVPAFYAYNNESRIAPVEQSTEYISLSLQIEDELKRKFSGIEEGSRKWTKYFKI